MSRLRSDPTGKLIAALRYGCQSPVDGLGGVCGRPPLIARAYCGRHVCKCEHAAGTHADGVNSCKSRVCSCTRFARLEEA